MVRSQRVEGAMTEVQCQSNFSNLICIAGE